MSVMSKAPSCTLLAGKRERPAWEDDNSKDDPRVGDAHIREVLFDGKSLAKLRHSGRFAYQAEVQPVFQNPYASLDPRFTIGRSISEPLDVHRHGSHTWRRDRVKELLLLVSLAPEVAARFPHELSSGQRQRAAIARALTLSPQLMVLDEAVSALDVVIQAQILKLLVRLQKELYLAYVFVSHDLAVVRQISHRVHVMKEGTIVESGMPDQLFDAPQHPYTKALIEAIPGHAVSLGP